MTNWDILILMPLIILLCTGFYYWLIYHYGFKKWRQWWYILQHGLFWFSLALILNTNYNFWVFNGLQSSFNWLYLLFGIGSLYAAIFFIPASWISAIIRSRKIYYWSSYLSAIIGIILLLLFNNNVTYIIGCVFIGLALSSNSLWFLSLNELMFHANNPFTSVFLLCPNLFLANVGGLIANQFIRTTVSSVFTQNYLFLIISILVLLFGMVLNWNIKEDRKIIGAYEPSFLKKISVFKWKKVCYIFLLLFIYGCVRELDQGDLILVFISQLSWDNYHNGAIVKNIIHFYQFLWWIFQIIGVICSGLLILKKIRLRWLICFSCVAWIMSIMFLMIFPIPVLFVIFQVLIGFSSGTMFAILFALVVMWNYRVPARPVTGIFSAINAFTGFIFAFVQRLTISNRYGLFSYLSATGDNSTTSFNWWSNLYIENNYNLYLNQLYTMYLIIAGVSILLLISFAIIFVWKNHFITGEYTHYGRRIKFILHYRNANVVN